MAKKTYTREKKVIKSIRLAWDSLISHLDDCAQDSAPKKIRDKYGVGGTQFHKKCVKEYAEIIKTLADSL